MPSYLTRASIIQCAHQGILNFPPDAQCAFLINGAEVLRKQTLLATPIAGCTWVGTGKVPCTKVVSLDLGDADEIEISGDVPVLDTIRVTTNGNDPKGTVAVGLVADNSSSNAETLTGGPSSPVRPDQPWNVSNLSWSKTEAREGDPVDLRATVQGLPDGTPVVARIFEHDADGRHDFVARFADARVSAGSVRIPWTFQYQDDVDDILTDEEAQEEGKRYKAPEYFFELRVAGRTFGAQGESGLLKFQDFLDLQVVDDATGDPIADLDVEILLPDGSKVTRRLDRSGRCRIERVPPGRCTVTFKEREQA